MSSAMSAIADVRKTSSISFEPFATSGLSVDAKLGEHLMDASCVETLHRHAEPSLHPERVLERCDIALFGNEEQVSDLTKVRIDAHLFGEVLDPRQRSQRQPHVDLSGELKAHAAGVARRRPATELIALEHDHVAHTTRREVVGDGSSNDAAPDDDDVCPLHARREVLLGLLRRDRRRSDAHHREHGLVQLEVVT